MTALKPKQKLFVSEYLNCWNATKAAENAGYSKKTARFIGCENLSKPHIQAEIEKAIQRRLTRIDISQDKLAQFWAAIVFASPDDLCNEGPDGEWVPKPFEELPPHIKQGIQKVSKYFADDGSGRTTYELLDKMKASELLGKHLGMFIERKEVGRPGDFNNLTDEELDRRIAEQDRIISAQTRKDLPTESEQTEPIPPVH